VESALQSRKKMKNKSIDLGRLYRVRELAEICGVNYLTALNLVKLGESDSVKIGRTYLITGERIQDRLTQKFMLY
jgi:excisionase family DNA binding protein|tara:strand:- start:112 stop:336 length:225 start_codon:yes stop_codon:yes gene_type:complete